MADFIFHALVILFALAVGGGLAWSHYLRGQAVGSIAIKGQGSAYVGWVAKKIVVKRNVSRGKVSSVDIHFKGSDRIVTVLSGTVPQLARTIESVAEMVRTGVRGSGVGTSFGTLAQMDIDLEPTYSGRRYVSLSFVVTQDEGPDLFGQALLTSEQALELVELLRIAAAPGATVAQARNARKRAGRTS